jgi:hypothetical protein
MTDRQREARFGHAQRSEDDKAKQMQRKQKKELEELHAAEAEQRAEDMHRHAEEDGAAMDALWA